MTRDTLISGTARPGFERVADAFAASFAGHPQMGASLAIYVDGRVVVDLWGGIADTKGSPWHKDTLSVIFSCTKGLTALVCASLVEGGTLGYDDPVVRWWPEFAAGGKAEVTLRHLLAHQAGLSAPRQVLTIDDVLDWDKVAGVLAKQEPLWTPGTGYAYHAITQGWLVGEVIRRATGKTVGELLSERITGPLRAEAYIGLPAAASHRMATMQVGESLARQSAQQAAGGENWPLLALTLGDALPLTLVTPDSGFNDPRLWSAEFPAAGGIADARSLARIWSATVRATDGVRLLKPETIATATRTQSEGSPVFEALPPWPRWGMGFQLDSDARRYLTPAGFGHDGAGGQVAFAEPGVGLGFAYLTNLMEGAGDTRATGIIDALRRVMLG